MSADNNITSDEIAMQRAYSLRIAATPPNVPAGFGCVEDVVNHHLAMQAQDINSSHWAIGSRLGSDAIRDDVVAAYDAGVIVRSWTMRGTLHTVCAQDLPWMLDLLGARALQGIHRRWNYLNINEKIVERCREIAIELLSGGGRATRSQLTSAIRSAGIDLNPPRSYHIAWYLAQTGTIVHGPFKNGQHLLVLTDEWVRNPKSFSSPQDGLAELGRRYLCSHAPARIVDLMWWSGITKNQAKIAFEGAADEFAPIRFMGDDLWVRRKARAQGRKGALDTIALAAFDEHLLGYKNRAEVLSPTKAHMVDPHGNGRFRATIVENGQTTATWRRVKTSPVTHIEVSPFFKWNKDRVIKTQHALERWASFTGTSIDVRINSAT